MFGIEGAKIGNSARIRLPNDYTVAEGPALSVQDTSEQQTTLTLTNQSHVDVGFTTADRTLSLDDYEERVLMPMLNVLAGRVAANTMAGVEGGVCNGVFNQDGSGNTIAPTSSTVLLAGAALTNNSAPLMARKLVTSPNTMAKTVDTLKGLFNPAPDISKQYKLGQIYDALNFRWFEDATVLNHTTGSFSAGTVNGAGQSSSGLGGITIATNAITGTLNKGDLVVINGVNAVNRVTKQSTFAQRQFVVTANAANGATSLSLYPGIVPGGGGYVPSTGIGGVQYQTVDVAPANGAAISLVNKASETYRKNFGFAKGAITLATADLVMPKRGVEEAQRKVYDGISMRMLTSYISGTDQLITRADVLYGSLFIRPEWAVILGDTILQ